MAFGVQLQPLNIAALDQSALQSTALDREMREQNALAKFLDMNGAGLASPNLAKREGVLSRMLGMGPRAMQFALPQINAARQERQRQEMLRGLLPDVFGAGAQPAPQAASVGSVPVPGNAGARMEQWRPIIAREAQRTGVDPALLERLIMQESGGRPDARGGVGEVGLGQIRPSTAQAPGFGVAPVNPAELANPERNIAFTADYLAGLIRANGGDVQRALMAYNGGQGNVQRGTVSPAAQQYAQIVGGGGTPAAAPAQGAPAAAPDDLGRRLVMAGMAANDPNMIAAGRALMERQTNMQTIRTAEGVFAFDPRTGRMGARLGGAPGPDTVVNMDNRAEGAEAKALGERYGAMAAGAHEAANKARNQIARIQQLEGMMRLFNTGRLAPAQVAAAGWARALGLDLSALGIQPNAAVSGEVIRAMTNALTLELIGAGGIPANNFSNADREFIAQIVPQLTNTPEANQILMQAMRRMSERAIEHERRWIAARRRGQSYGDFIGEWQEYVDKNSIAPNMPSPRTPDEAMRLPPGTVYLGPDGVVRQIDQPSAPAR